MTHEPILQVESLHKRFPVRTGWRKPPLWVDAVRSVSFSLARGETLGIIGESGCGKTTLARCILRLIEPDAGTIRLLGEDFRALQGRALRAFRRHIQMVFQDPARSLNPRMTVAACIAEPMRIHRMPGRQIRARIVELLEQVGLSSTLMHRYPGELSGGQRQRVAIARALALDPEVIVCDEVTAALDPSVQAQILNLLLDIQDRRQVSYIFIGHQLSVVRHISHRVAVMYMGEFVELAPVDHLVHDPLHPYTQILLDAEPVPDPARRSRPRKRPVGEVPSAIHRPSGCPFHPRCPIAEPICREVAPTLVEHHPGHWVACHLAAPVAH